jgi:hypothetical protein
MDRWPVRFSVMSTRRLLARMIVLLWSSICSRWAILDCLPDFGIGQIALQSKGLRLDIGRWNATLDQELLGSLDAPLRKLLVVLCRAAWIGMAFKNQMGVWFALEIGFEIGRQRD